MTARSGDWGKRSEVIDAAGLEEPAYRYSFISKTND